VIERPVAVVFDCDGVLVDSESHSRAAWVQVLGDLGHPATTTDVEACIGLGFVPTHASLTSIGPLPPPGEVWPILLRALARSFDTGLDVFADAVGLLDSVTEAGIAVAVASASPRQRLDLTLRAAGLADRFAVSVAGDEVAAPKPSPDVYLSTLRLLGKGPAGTWAIEDTDAGASAAVGAGMDVIAVVRDESSRARLDRVGVTVVDRLDPFLLGL
jgi:HAD superfamily hydrolase (TIGR01509 family)